MVQDKPHPNWGATVHSWDDQHGNKEDAISQGPIMEMQRIQLPSRLQLVGILHSRDGPLTRNDDVQHMSLELSQVLFGHGNTWPISDQR